MFLVFGVIIQKLSKPNYGVALLFLMAVLICISIVGFRDPSVGRDYESYYRYYIDSPNNPWDVLSGNFDPSLLLVDRGYIVINSIFKYFQFNGYQFIFFIGLISVTSIGYFFFKESKLYFLAFLIYFSHAFFYREMIQIRQGLCCALAMWLYLKVTERKSIHSILTLFTISTIHLASIIYIIPIMFYAIGWQPSRRTFIAGIAVSTVLLVFTSSNPQILDLVERVAQYQSTEAVEARPLFTNLTLYKQVIVTLFALNLYKILDRQPSSLVNIFLISYIVSTYWMIVFSPYEIIGQRLSNFMSIGEGFLVAELLWLITSEPKLSFHRTAWTSALLLLPIMIFFTNHTVYSERLNVVPYKFNMNLMSK